MNSMISRQFITGTTYLLMVISLLIGFVVAVMLMLKGVIWLSTNIYPVVSDLAAVALIVLLPCSLLLAIFKKTSAVAGIGLLITFFTLGISVWLWSVLLAHSLAGIAWMIAGIVCLGVGVIPIAMIAAMFHAEWAVLLQLIGLSMGMYILLALSGLLIERAFSTKE